MIWILILILGFFVLATEALYDLSRKVLKDEYLAYKENHQISWILILGFFIAANEIQICASII